MKIIFNPFLSTVLAVSLISICPSAFGAQIYKDAATPDMNTVANWSTVFNAATPDPASIGTTDTLRFNEMFAVTSGTDYTASISADLAAGGIKLDNGSGGGGAPGTGNVIINGTNTLTLNGTLVGDSQYTNAIFVLNSGSGGSLTVNPNILIGAAGTQIVASRNLNLNGTLNWGNFGMTNNIAGGTTTVAGVVSGSGNWSKSGAGTYYFSNTANTFNGSVAATGGVLKVNKLADGASNSSLGAGSSTISLTGATLEYAGGTTDSTNRSITMGGNATISNTGSGTVSFTAANVVQSGTASARTLTLTGSNTNSNTFGSIIGNSGSGANITGLAKSGAGTWTISGANNFSGSTAVNNGTLTVSGATNGTSSVTVNGGASLVIATGGALTTSGVLATAVATGANITVQNGASLNAASAAIAWNPGTFQVDGTLALTGSFSVSTNATATISGTNGTITAASFSTGNASTTVNFTNTGAMTLSGALTIASTAGAGAAVFSQSAGTVNTLGVSLGDNQANTSGSRTFTLTGGRINIGASGLASTGTTTATRNVNLGAGTVGASADWSSTLAMSLTNTATGVTFNTLDSIDNNTARTITLSGVLSGTGQLVKNGAGTLTLSGPNTYTGLTSVKAGTLAVIANTSLGSNLSNVSGESSAIVDFGANTITLGNATAGNTGAFFYGKLIGTGTLQLRGGSQTIQNSDGTGSTSGNYQILSPITAAMPTSAFALDTGSSATSRKDFGFVNDTNDVLTLSSLSGYGAIRGDAGGPATRFITVAQSSGDTVFNGALLSHKSGAGFVRALTFEKTGSSMLELAGFIGKETSASAAGAAAVNLTANGGVLSVTNAANTTTANTDAISLGTVTITSGTLAFSNQALINTAGNAGATSIAMNGGTLKWNSGNTQDITAGNRLTLVAGKLATFNTNGNDVVLSNALGGGAIAAAVTKDGAGNLTLGGVNTYSGNTTVNAGTLTLAVNAGLKFVIGASSGVNNKITGAGDATLSGNFTLDLSAAAGAANGSTWTLADVVGVPDFTPTFTVVGFDDSDLNNIWTKTEGDKTWSFNENDAILTLSISGGGGYGDWTDANAGSQDPNLDFDNDGVSNGVEYFLGETGSSFTANPGLDGTNTVTWTNGAGLPIGDYGTQYVVQKSTDLVTWTPVPNDGSDLNLVVTAGSVKYTLNGSGPQFVRLVVTPN